MIVFDILSVIERSRPHWQKLKPKINGYECLFYLPIAVCNLPFERFDLPTTRSLPVASRRW